MIKTHSLGFPRIGKKRELKIALESFWNGKDSTEQLLTIAKELRERHWQLQTERRIDLIPALDFSLYDAVLDHSLLFNLIPERIQKLGQIDPLTSCFLMARGKSPTSKLQTEAGEMTKWFDTNYHYITPEVGRFTKLALKSEPIIQQIKEAHYLRFEIKPVLIGPVTLLWLAKSTDPNFDKLSLLKDLLLLYRELLIEFYQHGITWVQFDEPVAVLELDKKWREAFLQYQSLLSAGPNIMLATYFGSIGENLKTIAETQVHAVHIDLVRGKYNPKTVHKILPKHTEISLGLVDGRNIWKNNFKNSFEIAKPWLKTGRKLWVAPSCSLLHCPIDLDNERSIKKPVVSWLSFAKQKLTEVDLLRVGLQEGIGVISKMYKENQKIMQTRNKSSLVTSSVVRKEMKKITTQWSSRSVKAKKRFILQQEKLQLPLFPTTTIGSFPQTPEIRKMRADSKQGRVTKEQYNDFIKKQIAHAVSTQEAIGLDVLVHGEAERNDMTEFFGELLKGFVITSNGWVQSYGSRCVKPPIIYGDISRSKPMTVDLTSFAAGLTKKPMKGMLTGPVTMLCWSFTRDDLPKKDICLQLALALRKEVNDLEKAGISIIQIDEPALREGLPLHKKERKAYLDWAVKSFKIATCGVGPETQIHTHMCYSEFNDIMESIIKLDADVITIETSRSKMELLEVFKHLNYPNQIGPGVYDIHSPNTPTRDSIKLLLKSALTHLSQELLWINPDCGLKTRTWDEVTPALSEMVKASHELRSEYKRKV
ncbi:MAG: 5-methyltetrahydropteroyltriglutamate--homocysteine S-methyltransferase [Methylacidiphilales bacterium]|nr:5-methyltetrahydropteroyltriglutamate--homocysteine S-methyltransferase [Candidatus Methylacidiphilales bacterium]